MDGEQSQVLEGIMLCTQVQLLGGRFGQVRGANATVNPEQGFLNSKASQFLIIIAISPAMTVCF